MDALPILEANEKPYTSKMCRFYRLKDVEYFFGTSKI